MKSYLVNLGRFLFIGFVPLVLLLVLYVNLDPFKVVNTYDTFYDMSAKGWVGLNKDYVSTTTFDNNSKKYTYNSFVFGNSRSMFYEVADWKPYLKEEDQCFHFDASGEALYALHKKVLYLDKKNVTLNNVILVLDESVLKQDRPKSGHMHTISPQLIDGDNFSKFHFNFFKAFLNPKFLYAFIDFKLSNEVKPYMKSSFLLDDRPFDYDLKTNEIRYEHFERLADSGKYYTPKRMSVFFKRPEKETFSPSVIKEGQEVLLNEIKAIFKKHNTNYKVVINPLYNQIKLGKEDLVYLQGLFGNDNVFDFSGKNAMTEDYNNYYEKSHYRPHIAKEILKKIYSK